MKQNTFTGKTIESPETLQFSKRNTTWTALVALVFFMVAGPALAQDAATTGLCAIANMLKNIGSVAAIIAIVMMAINSFFVKSSLMGDIILVVLIAGAIMAIAPTIISSLGLTHSCTFG